MKKVLALLMVLVMAAGMLAGCAKEAPVQPVTEEVTAPAPEQTAEEISIEEKDGLTIYTDLKNSPFEESGLRITVKKGENGYAKFVKTDLQGRDTVDYYTFDYSKNILEKYYYVSAMGSAYYYYYDLNKKELYRVEDQEHKDITQTMKDSGRLETAQTKIAGEIGALEGYYKEQLGTTIIESVLGAAAAGYNMVVADNPSNAAPVVAEKKVEEKKPETKPALAAEKKTETKKPEPAKETKPAEPAQEGKFAEVNGVLTYTDLKNSPFEDTGLKITIQKGSAVKLVKTDAAGKETVDYYNFDYSDNTMTKFYYVAGMGKNYYYSYDLSSGQLTKVEDGDHQDITQTMKDSNRWDSANTKLAGEVKSLEDYFKAQYGMTIKEAALQK